jgi:hypothetical protein
MAVQRLVNVGVNAGDFFDPVPMQFYVPERTLVNNEPKVTYKKSIQVHIRLMTGMTREMRMQGRQENTGVQIFRIRRNAVTERIDHTFVGVWRGRTYELIGDPTFPNLEELECYGNRTDKVMP